MAKENPCEPCFWSCQDDERKKCEALFLWQCGSDAIQFKYKNWEGHVSLRTVRPEKIWFGKTEYHKEEQWFIHAWDFRKNAYRDFSLVDIQCFG